jgi:hypothetical protein
VRFDRIRQAPIDTRRCQILEAAELQDHARLALLHDKETAGQPQANKHRQQHTDAQA